jgi:hypothetical protein
MADRRGPSYGTPNMAMLGRWLQLDPAADGPFWAINLMRYRQVADYGTSGRQVPERPPRSGREADDAYSPLASLHAIGAHVVFHADVVGQPLGEPGWHRIGVVRYPSRAAFLAMQRRDDFQRQHVHKEAGMEFTIVMAAHPARPHRTRPTEGRLVMRVERGEPGAWAAMTGVHVMAEFAVEGVIVGDERTFHRVLFARADDDAVAALDTSGDGPDEVHAVVLEPGVDRLMDSIAGATD